MCIMYILFSISFAREGTRSAFFFFFSSNNDSSDDGGDDDDKEKGQILSEGECPP